MADNDKLFEFMTKMYSEMQNGFKTVNGRMDGIENEISEMKTDIKKIGSKIDGELIPTQKALLDGYKDNAEHITIIDDKIDRLQVDVNNISMKTTYNDSRIIEISKDLKKAK